MSATPVREVTLRSLAYSLSKAKAGDELLLVDPRIVLAVEIARAVEVAAHQYRRKVNVEGVCVRLKNGDERTKLTVTSNEPCPPKQTAGGLILP